MDYQGNSKREREEKASPDKRVQRVTQGEVIVQKKTLGRKFREVFIEADFRSVVRYVISDVLLPAARNTIVDASTKGIERMMYGDAAMRRRGYPGMQSRVTYQTPVSRAYPASPISRSAPTLADSRSSRLSPDDFVISTKEEADLVLERMTDIIDQYQIVSVADLKELVGFPTNHVDNKWGWDDLSTVRVIQVRDGYLIDLPPTGPIQ